MVNGRTLYSLWLIFFINGAVLSSWTPRIPEVAAALDIGDGALGVALLGFAAGAIPAMTAAIPLTRQIPAPWVCCVSVAVFSAGLPFIALADSSVVLFAVLVGMGVSGGLCDITMNLTALDLQHRRQQGLLGRFHSGFSLGVVAGGLGAVAATTMGMTVPGHFTAVAALLLLLVTVAGGVLLRQRDIAHSAARRLGQPRPGRLNATVVALAIFSLLIEGLITDWSALLLTRDFAAPAATGALTLTLFSLAMVASRAFTDPLIRRVGESAVLVAGALVAAAAIPLAVGLGVPWIVMAAIVSTGAAIGPMFPIAMNRAARRGDPSTSITRVSVFGYTANLAGPLAIGLVASGAGLPATVIGAVVLAAAGILLTALPSRRQR